MLFLMVGERGVLMGGWAIIWVGGGMDGWMEGVWGRSSEFGFPLFSRAASCTSPVGRSSSFALGRLIVMCSGDRSASCVFSRFFFLKGRLKGGGIDLLFQGARG